MKNLFVVKRLISLAIIVFTAGCDVMHQDTIPSFIYAYYDINEIGATIRVDNIIELNQISHVVVCNWQSKGNKKQLYDSLCNANKDTGYNKKIEYFATPEEDETIAKYKYDYYSIDVTSDADFDAEHPKGALLNDIIMYYGTTVKYFIENRYRYEYDWENIGVPEVYRLFTPMRALYSTPVCKGLSEMTPDDYQLCLGFALLVFEREPLLSKIHNLTITVKNSAGKTIPISFYANGTRDNPRTPYVPIKFE